MTMHNRAVFLDRDGVINQYLPGEYVRFANEFVILPGVPEAILRLNKHHYHVSMVTNQQGIGKGLMCGADLDKLHGVLYSALERVGAHLDATRICPHLASAQCPCRKPAPGMFLDLAEAFGIDLSHSIFIGDTSSDAAAAAAAGIGTFFLVLTGKSSREDASNPLLFPIPPAGIFSTLPDAVDYILTMSARD